MKLKKNSYYCVMTPNGHLLEWSLATNRSDSWLRFTRGVGDGKWSRSKVTKAKLEGLKCARLKVELAIRS